MMRGRFLAAWACAALAVPAAATLFAEDGPSGAKVQVGPNGVNVEARKAAEPGLADGAIRFAGPAYRGTSIIGRAVKNEAGKDLGQVKDIVIDMDSGTIRYAALSYGGFLGLGDKLFAVPWHAFEWRKDVASNEHFLVLNVAEARLKQAPGFDADHWPNFADPKWNATIDEFYPRRKPAANPQ